MISSGLLELYAAGIASEEERKDVEQWASQYPEVAAELKTIVSTMDTYVNAHAIMPSPHVKEKIFSRILVGEDGFDREPAIPEFQDGKRIEIVQLWRVAAAASVILLIGSIALNIITYNKFTETDKRLEITRKQLATIQETNKSMEAGLSIVQSKYSVPVSLKGLEAAPNAAAKVFWMQNTGEVFFDPSNLPEAPAGKQYQLWGIVDGKPVDGGMILTSSKGDRYRIQKMKSFGKVEAFAVTLEDEKGNATPQGPMFVMGKML